MRKTFCLLITFFCLLSSSMARGETTPVITVSSPLELINAIGPDRIIRIDRDVLELPAERVAFNNEFVVQEEVPDGYQLSIRNVSNLTITSVGEKPVRILAQPRYAYILAFQNVQNIKISRVEAGHTPGDNVCIAGVFYFENSRCIEVDQTVLFGCGSRGVELSGVSDFTFKDSEIRECVYGIMTIDHSDNCLFVNSVFTENEGWYLIDVGQSKNIRFSQCQIENNKALSSESSSIFDVSISEEVLVEDCIVEGNTAAWFIDNGDGLVVKDTPLDLNRFNSYRPSYREKYSYEDYYENLYLLQFYQFEEQMRGEVSPRAMVKDIYTNMVRALEELREDMTDDEVEYLLGSYYAVGYLLKILPTMEKAEVIFKKLLQKDSYSIHANLALAELYYLEGVSEELQPSGDGWSYICVWKQSDLMEIALQHFLAAYQLEKQQDEEVLAPISHYRIFVLHCFQGEFAKAIDHLEGLTPADPAQYLNCLELGRQLEKTHENPRVIEILL